MAERLAATAARAAPALLEVLPDNWDAVQLFCAMGTQWRRAGMSGVATGLDYAALPVPAAAMRITLDADLLSRLQVIEMEALRLMLGRG